MPGPVRVLFTTTPGRGHLHAMVPLARAFVERGDDVLWATGASSCAWLERDRFAAAPAGLDEREGMEEFARRFPEFGALAPPQRPEFMFPRLFGAVRAEPMLRDLEPVARRFAPDLIVRDATEFAGAIVGAALGVRAVTHSFGALLPAARVASVDPELEHLWASRGLEPRPYGGSYDDVYLDIYPASLQPPGDRSHVGVTESLRPATSAIAGDDALPAWLTDTSGDRVPLVYVTLGTVFSDAGVLATVVEGLHGLRVRAVVTVGPHGDPAALGPQPPHVHVTRYLAQDALLPRCAVVVSHAGSGTFLASLAHGLPHLCVPQAADQFLNAAACEASGAGIALMPDDVSPATVAAAVERLLDDPAFRDAAAVVAADIAAMPAAGEVAGRLAGAQ
jgi:UDP:flavonoid glycosyltransferase YjiC (YdhE family)